MEFSYEGATPQFAGGGVFWWSRGWEIPAWDHVHVQFEES